MVSRDPPDGLAGVLTAGRAPRLTAGAVIVLVLAALAVAVLVSAFGSHGASTPAAGVRSSTAPAPVEATIYVHLLGAVASPGLYGLPENSRVIDAVAAAGGFADQADQGAVNLARFLSDGEQLFFPALGESPAAATGSPGIVAGKVNINTADAATLETLPRVGPAMAERIIAWRETNGRFSAVEELKSVTGIGDKTFSALSELVTV